MAENQNVIDTLSIEIEASAKDAVKGLSQLETRLRGLASATKNLSGVASSLGTMSIALQKMGNINTGGLAKAVDQLERIKKLNLKDERIKLDVRLTGADEAERKVYAIQEAVKNIDTKKLSKEFSDALGLKGIDATRVRQMYDRAIADLASGGNGSRAFTDWTNILNVEGLQVVRGILNEQESQILDEYRRFLKNLEKHPVSYTKGSADAIGGGITSFKEVIGDDDSLYKYFKQAGDEISSARWDDLIEQFPTIMAGARGAGDAFEYLFAKVKEAKAALERVDLRNLTGNESSRAWNVVIGQAANAATEMKDTFQTAVGKAMNETATKIPLDVTITGTQIENKIRAAIKSAAKTYDVPIRLTFNTNELKDSLKTILSGVSIADLGTVVTEFRDFGQVAQTIAGVNFKGNGFTPFVNSVNKLSNVTIDPSLVTGLKDISTALKSFADMPNISSNITRLISALARLVETGNRMKAVTAKLPDFAEAIRKVATILSQLGGVNPLITQFIDSLSRLTAAGQQMPVAAQNLDQLSDALQRMIASLGKSSVSHDISGLVASIAQLSTALGSINQTGVRNVNNSSNKMGVSLQKLARIVDKVLSKILNLFKKIGSGIASVAKKVVSNITGINRASKSMFTVSDGIKSVIGGLLGMRGLTGVFNWTKEAITAGGDITEINHIIESVFEEDMVDAVDTWATEAIEKFGIASGAAKHYAGVLSSMFQASGVSMREAGEMGMRLTEMAGDLSAFYNIDTEAAYQKIQSGMAGMVRPLRSLGIDLSVASLQEYALSQGITKKVSAMTQAEKVMLRYHYLLQATSQATGDFARTSDKLKTVA